MARMVEFDLEEEKIFHEDLLTRVPDNLIQRYSGVRKNCNPWLARGLQLLIVALTD
jgi:hypothetical protein